LFALFIILLAPKRVKALFTCIEHIIDGHGTWMAICACHFLFLSGSSSFFEIFFSVNQFEEK
jgi:hypothetical protein